MPVNKHVCSENRTVNAQKDDLEKLTHVIYHSRRRRKKETYPGIGITFKFSEADE